MKVNFEFDIGNEDCFYEDEEVTRSCYFFNYHTFECRLFEAGVLIGTSSDPKMKRCYKCLKMFPPVEIKKGEEDDDR